MKFSLRGHSNPVTSVCFIPTGLVSGDESGILFLWDCSSRRPIRSWPGHPTGNGGVLALAYMHGILFSQGRDDTIHAWNVSELLTEKDPEPIRSLYANAINFCMFSMTDELLFALPNRESTTHIDVYDYASHSFVSMAIGVTNASKDTGMCTCIRLVKEFLVAGYENGSVILWNWKEKSIYMRFASHSEPVTALDVTIVKDTIRIVSVGGDDKVVQYSIDIASKHSTTTVKQLGSAGASDVIHYKDQTLVGSWDGSLKILTDFEIKGQVSHHRETIRKLCIGEMEGQYTLAIASNDGRISIWELPFGSHYK